jgi:hypothetical protein
MPIEPKKHGQRQQPEFENGLPAAEEHEKLLLGLVLMGKLDFGELARVLRLDDFITERHQRIFRAMLAMHEAGISIDPYTLGEELQKGRLLSAVGGLTYIVSLEEGMPALSHSEQYMRIVRDKAVQRAMILTADAIARRVLHMDADTDELIASGIAAFQSLQTRSDGGCAEPAAAAVQWPALRPEAMHGPAGELVKLFDEHTESDPVALLMQALVGFGNLIGRCGYFLADGSRHHSSLYLVITGETSKARKGTSWNRVAEVLSIVDDHWAEHCLLSGVGSGEALIDGLDGESGDRRRLIQEGEFARVLAVMLRDGQTLSPILRTTWDTGRADIQTRQNERHIRNAHLSMIAHITIQELRRNLKEVELANGLANRVLFCCARRSKSLPFGGGSPNVAGIARKLREAADHARKLGNTRVDFDDDAKVIWGAEYERLAAGRPGLLGAVTSRSEAQCLRLCLLYALLDGARAVQAEHLRAALAVMDYCNASARYIWGDRTGDAVADRAIEALRFAGDKGLTRTELFRDVFRNNADSSDIERALNLLTGLGLIRAVVEGTGNKATTRYFVL